MSIQRNVKITSTPDRRSTEVRDAETGELIPGVTSVIFEHRGADEYPVCEIEMFLPEAEIETVATILATTPEQLKAEDSEPK